MPTTEQGILTDEEYRVLYMADVRLKLKRLEAFLIELDYKVLTAKAEIEEMLTDIRKAGF